jgi:hypothetical protein
LRQLLHDPWRNGHREREFNVPGARGLIGQGHLQRRSKVVRKGEDLTDYVLYQTLRQPKNALEARPRRDAAYFEGPLNAATMNLTNLVRYVDDCLPVSRRTGCSECSRQRFICQGRKVVNELLGLAKMRRKPRCKCVGTFWSCRAAAKPVLPHFLCPGTFSSMRHAPVSTGFRGSSTPLRILRTPTVWVHMTTPCPEAGCVSSEASLEHTKCGRTGLAAGRHRGWRRERVYRGTDGHSL